MAAITSSESGILAPNSPPQTPPKMAMDENEASPLATKFPIFSSASPMTAELDHASLETAAKVLQIIDRYRLRRAANATTKADEGALKFLALIYTHVKAGEVIPMCLPAFPFKSPNSTSKVLGKLPDRAEDLALSHLNGLCASIQRVYAPGAKLTIISDGLVYNGMHTETATARTAMIKSNVAFRFAGSRRQGCLGVRRVTTQTRR